MTNRTAAQSQNSLDSLLNCYTIYHNSILVADLQQYRIKEKYKSLKWLPTVGYDAFRNSPIITFSFNAVSNNIANNAINKAKIAEITMKYNLLLKERLQEIAAAHSNLSIEIEILEYRRKVFETEKEIFLLQKELYESHQTKPLDFLNSKLKFLQNEISFKELENLITVKRSNLLMMCKCQ